MESCIVSFGYTCITVMLCGLYLSLFWMSDRVRHSDYSLLVQWCENVCYQFQCISEKTVSAEHLLNILNKGCNVDKIFLLQGVSQKAQVLQIEKKM